MIKTRGRQKVGDIVHRVRLTIEVEVRNPAGLNASSLPGPEENDLSPSQYMNGIVPWWAEFSSHPRVTIVEEKILSSILEVEDTYVEQANVSFIKGEGYVVEPIVPINPTPRPMSHMHKVALLGNRSVPPGQSIDSILGLDDDQD